MNRRDVILLLVLMTLVVFTGNWLDGDTFRQKMNRPSLINHDNQSQASIPGLLGLRCVTADFLWINAMQYLGDDRSRSEGYRFFPGYIEDIVRLDPNFTYAYLNGSAVMMWLLKRTDGAIALLKEGFRYNPGNIEIPRYLFAFTYFRVKDFNKMLPLLEKIVYETPGHPPMVERILGNIYERLNESGPAERLWRWMLEHPSEKENTEYAKNKLKDHNLWKE